MRFARFMLSDRARAAKRFSLFGMSCYDNVMSTQLEEAVAVVRRLPPQQQDEIAAAIRALAGEHEAPVALTADEDAALARSEAEADRGMFASDAQVRAAWAKHGL